MYPLLWLSGAFLLGLLLASRVSLPAATWFGLAGAALALALAERRWLPAPARRARCPLPLAMVMAALLAGAGRWQAAQPALTSADLAWYNGQGEFRLRGWLAAPTERMDRATRARVRVEAITPLAVEGGTAGPETAVDGLLLAWLPPGFEGHYGQRIELTGALEPPPEGGTFSYRAYLARQGVYSQMNAFARPRTLSGQAGSGLMRAIYALRARAQRALYALYPPPESALLSGILLGLDDDLPEPLERAFQETGTAHIIAISGFNIALLAGLFFRLFGRIWSRWGALLATVLALVFYTLLVGAEPSVTRAAIMGSLALFGREIGRRSGGLNTLACAAAVMSAFRPGLPWDAAFQLSFMATLGLVLYADPLDAALRRWAALRLPPAWAARLAGPVSEYFLFTLAAQITTLPVMAAHFGRVSLSALLANPLVLPVQPALMVLSGLAVILGTVWLPLGKLAAWAAWPLAAYTTHTVELLARLPGAVRVNAGDLPWLVLFYAALFAWTLARRRLPALRPLLAPSFGLAALGLAAAFTWQAGLSLPDGNLRLTLFNLDGQTAALARAPSGAAVLVLPGSDPGGLLPELARRLPAGRRRIDLVVLVSPGKAAAEGLADLAAELPVQAASAPPGLWDGLRPAAEMDLIAAEVDTANLEPGQTWNLGGGVSLTAVALQDDRAALLVEWGSFRALLPAGLEPGLVGAALPVSVLGVEDAGSAEEGLERWSARDAQIFVALSADQTGLGAQALPAGGRLEIVTNGEKMWVEVGSR